MLRDNAAHVVIDTDKATGAIKETTGWAKPDNSFIVSITKTTQIGSSDSKREVKIHYTDPDETTGLVYKKSSDVLTSGRKTVYERKLIDDSVAPMSTNNAKDLRRFLKNPTI